MFPDLVGLGAVTALCAVAAVTDGRRGVIPNWLTLPPLVIGPLGYLLFEDWQAALSSIVGIFICGLIPYLLFRLGSMGGGDVKLMAAVGAFVGVSQGLQIGFYSLIAAALYALGRLAYERKLLQTFMNSFFIVANLVLPAKWKRTIVPTSMSHVRLGAAFLTGSAIVLFTSLNV